MRKVSLVIVGAFAITLLLAGVATARVTTCTGKLASGAYNRLVVPPGATCDGTKATVRVSRGVQVGTGATFILGSEQSTDTGTIREGIRANAPASLQVHFASIRGGVRMHDGNGEFSTVEDSAIHGGVALRDYSGFWLGFIRNRVHGDVSLNNNQMDDPDANEFVTNRIWGDLVCRNNSPAPQVGDSQGQPNVVTGRKIDQCASL